MLKNCANVFLKFKKNENNYWLIEFVLPRKNLVKFRLGRLSLLFNTKTNHSIVGETSSFYKSSLANQLTFCLTYRSSDSIGGYFEDNSKNYCSILVYLANRTMPRNYTKRSLDHQMKKKILKLN